MQDIPQRHTKDTRIWVTNANLDIHLAKLDEEVLQSFNYMSFFNDGNMAEQATVADETNTYRFDLMGATGVKGRKAGQVIENQKIANDKQTIVVDTMEYNRVTMDWMDNWTSPNRIAHIGKEQGIAMAKTYDLNHLVTLIKGGEWKADAVLKASGAFNDGVSITIDKFSTYDAKVQAQAIQEAHAYLVDTFIKRNVGKEQLVTLVSSDWYSILANSLTLTDTSYQGNQNENNRVHRRVMYINGVKIIELPIFLNKERTDAPLGEDFNLDTALAKANMIVFNPNTSLVRVDAHGLTTRHYDMEVDMVQYLDAYRMYTVAIKRGDAIGVVHADQAYVPNTDAEWSFTPPATGGNGGTGGGLGG